MFDWQPISTTNVISIAQIIVVLVGFIFSWRGLRATSRSIEIANDSLGTACRNLNLATANAQAQLYNQMVIQGRDLQFKFMEIYHNGDGDENRLQRQRLYTGAVIGYYAACYGLRNVLELPRSVEKMLDSELSELMRQEGFRKQWDQISHLHSKEFVSYVASLRGV